MKTPFPPLTSLALITALFSLAFVAPQAQALGPGHNDFYQATVLQNSDYSDATDLLNFTRQSLEPTHTPDGSADTGKSAWWRWTAPENGYFTVDTLASRGWPQAAVATTIAVYTGSEVYNLRRVASNDQYAEPGSGNASLSRVSFYAEKGITYRIAVDGDGPGQITQNYSMVRVQSRFMPLRRMVRAGVVLDTYPNSERRPMGFLTLAQTATATFSGKLILDGKSHSFSGAFAADGRSLISIPRKAPLPPITLDLDGSEYSSYFLYLHDGGFRNGSLYEKKVFTKEQPNTWVGRYNVVMNELAGNKAPGIMSLTVAASGAVTAAVTAPDGTKIALSTAIYATYGSPTIIGYTSLSGGLGGFSLVGYLTGNGASNKFNGAAAYRRPPAKPGALLYPAGMNVRLEFEGQIYGKPAPKSRAHDYLDATEGVADLRITATPGELGANLTESVTLSEANRFTYLQPTVTVKPTLTLNPTTGLVTGAMTFPGAGQKKRAIQGILYRLNNVFYVKGFVTGPTQSLRMEIVP